MCWLLTKTLYQRKDTSQFNHKSYKTQLNPVCKIRQQQVSKQQAIVFAPRPNMKRHHDIMDVVTYLIVKDMMPVSVVEKEAL